MEPSTEKGLTKEEVEAMLPDKEPTTVAATEEDLALDIDVDAFVKGEIPEEVLDAPILDGLAGTPAKPAPAPALEDLAPAGATLATADDEDDTDDDDYFEEDTDDEENLDEPPE